MNHDLQGCEAVFELAFREPSADLHPPKPSKPLQGLAQLSGLTGKEAVPLLDAALTRMRDPKLSSLFKRLASEKVRKEVLASLTSMRAAAVQFPEGEWTVQMPGTAPR